MSLQIFPKNRLQKCKTGILAIFLLTTQLGSSQNIVINGDFENHSSLPVMFSEWYKCNNWTNANNCPTPSSPCPTPDYFHTLGGGDVRLPNSLFATVTPFSGDAIMGFATSVDFVPEYREYISAQLSTPMLVGKQYQVSFALTNGNSSHLCGNSSDHLGIQFSVSPLLQLGSGNIGGIPQIEIPGQVWSTNWTAYSFNFTADSTYNHLLIGNCYNDASTTTKVEISTSSKCAYYFIDKIEIVPLIEIQITGDSAICLGDSTTLVARNDTVLSWADSLSPNLIIATDSILTVAPTNTTTYLVYGTNDTASFTVNVYNPSLKEFGNDTTLCQGDILKLDVTQPNANYLWQDNSTKPTFSTTQQGTYWVEVNVNNCSSTDTINVNYNPLPYIYLGNDTTLCHGEILKLDATTPSAIYLWQDNTSKPTFNVFEQGTYWLELTVNNCSITDVITIEIEECDIVFEMPNVFTPNHDGMNDLLVPIKSKGIVSIRTNIYNRWGNKIFETTNPLIEWNAQNVNGGTYFWIIYYTDINGNENELNGYFTIIK